ncbi:hypothetical protein [Deinococcus arenicola]|uniref:CopG family transcriptional regulator n=1 Tax=Deinococcus arenicola TaxID=2994950 RepID=A0ABU4DTL8_9DEIO|nr:hypothetical protein [Deinococcus sp. ZS9-10]MDV6375307.1 hypothetical protein [Deinococcus sp. ZS9-10]
MARFDYLDDQPKKKGKKTKILKAVPEPGGRSKGESGERVEVVYIRKETLRAVWREVRRDGDTAESVSELVEDLLLAWLRERA